MKIKLTPFHFRQIIDNHYSWDETALLAVIYEGNNITEWLEEGGKISSLFQGLIRKALITEDGKITSQGQQIIDILNSTEKKLLKKIPSQDEGFDAWWKEYPSSDNFTYRGRKFEGCRNLRNNPSECRIKFDKIINEGYKPEEMVEALKLDVQRKKEFSYKRGENKISYMQNSLTYLNQRSFEAFVEEVRNGEKVTITQNNTYDGINL